ncbi:shikimate kinase [Tumidithrix helvetica PCC 7403]|uniref:shikimate kinase n=1 Tax=Tumidithrix helvetica TaxID=3457545 RepID=UPI003CB11658
MLKGTSVFLIGMMGAGKSTIGKLLAAQLDYRFLDTDQLVETCAGQTIPEIFARSGEASFREIEHQVLGQVSAYTRLVVATGGGIVLNQMNWSHLHHGLVVWLDVPVPVLYDRLTNATVQRPLLQTENPLLTLTNIYEQRWDRYAQADIRITVGEEESSKQVCERTIEAIAKKVEPDRLKVLPEEVILDCE